MRLLFTAGGVFIYPLLFLSVICVAYILERFFFFLRNPPVCRKTRQALQNEDADYFKNSKSRDLLCWVVQRSLAESDKENFSEVFDSYRKVAVSKMEKGLNIILGIANLAPLLGFLGTVSGMINAFRAIAAVEQVSASVVARGIYEALLTTVTGLSIAVPAFFFFEIFQFLIERFNAFCNEAKIIIEKGRR